MSRPHYALRERRAGPLITGGRWRRQSDSATLVRIIPSSREAGQEPRNDKLLSAAETVRHLKRPTRVLGTIGWLRVNPRNDCGI